MTSLETGQRTPSEALGEFRALRRNEYSAGSKPVVQRLSQRAEDDDGAPDVCQCSSSSSSSTSSKNRRHVGCDSTCVNRQLQVECDPKTCPVETKWGKGACLNQRLSRHEDAVKGLKVKECKGRGVGVFASKPISKHALVAEYVGEVITERECERRLRKEYAMEKHKYLMCMSHGLVIDATRKGNLARFLNHSCSPNCVVEEWKVQGLPRMAIFAMRDIKPGEELCFDYNFQRYGEGEQKCYCGAETCRGILGGEKKRAAAAQAGKRLAESMLGRDPILEDKLGVTMSVERAKKVARLLLSTPQGTGAAAFEAELERGEALAAFLSTRVREGLRRKFGGEFWPAEARGDPAMFR